MGRTHGRSRSRQGRRAEPLEGMSGGILSTSLLNFAYTEEFHYSFTSTSRFTTVTTRWRKDVRSRENAARSRSKVAANNLPTQVAANRPTPQVAQLPSRVAANQPTSIFEENVQGFSSTPKTEEVRKPKRRIAYGCLLYH